MEVIRPILIELGKTNSKEMVDELMNICSRVDEGGDVNELRHMIEVIRPALADLGKAKASKMVRDLVDLCMRIEHDGDTKIGLIKESIEWATTQNRQFLRQMLQARLVRLYNDLQRYTSALQLATELVRELKKVDDKELIIDVQLEESRACYALSSLSKARAALTSARTTANSTYVQPIVQAGLDMQSGILHAADEKDFQTAFSYFYEAFEGFDFAGDKREATRALKYMLLSKVMLDAPEETNQILAHKNATKYSGDEVNAMVAVAKAAKNRSLKEFNAAFGHYRDELQCDAVVRKHFNALSDTMMEKELCRLIEPYSYVEIEHIANQIGLPRPNIEKKLAQMILDQKFSGCLHQGEGMLVVYDSVPEYNTYDLSVQTIRAMGEVVDVLYKRAQTIR